MPVAQDLQEIALVMNACPDAYVYVVCGVSADNRLVRAGQIRLNGPADQAADLAAGLVAGAATVAVAAREALAPENRKAHDRFYAEAVATLRDSGTVRVVRRDVDPGPTGKESPP